MYKMIQGQKAVLFTTVKKWRQWLEKNHANEIFIWLILKKKKSDIKCISYQEALDVALCFGWIDGIVKSCDSDVFIQRFTPRRPNSAWSRINKEKVLTLIKQGKMTDAGRSKINDAKKNGNWEKAYGKDVPQPIPDDLKNALKATRGAWKNFSDFAPSTQRSYIAWVNFVKREDARQRRIKKVVDFSLKKIKPGML